MRPISTRRGSLLLAVLALALLTGCGHHTTTAPPKAVIESCLQAKTSGSPVTDQADRLATAGQPAAATGIYQSVLDGAGSTPAERNCAAQGLAALALTKTPSSQPQQGQSRWDALYKADLSPIFEAGTPALVVFAGLLSLTRAVTSRTVGVRTPGPRSRSRSDRAVVFGSYWLSVFALAVAAMLGTVGLALAVAGGHTTAFRWLLGTSAGLAVALGLLGLVLPARYGWSGAWRWTAAPVVVWAAVSCLLGWRYPTPGLLLDAVGLAVVAGGLVARIRGCEVGMQLQGYDADGKDDAGLAEFVRVRLHAIGTQAPRGIQVTQQTDVSSLPSSALGLIPDGPLAKGLALIAQLFLPSTPWRAVVTEQDGGTVVVVLSRNGEVCETAVISSAQFGLPPLDPAATASAVSDRAVALRSAAAAFILLSLAKRYRYLNDGLVGATDWRSVAAQVIGTGAGLPADQQVAVLAHAVTFDGGNLAARVALLNVQYRDGADLAETLRYATALEAICGEHKFGSGTWATGYEALQLRVLFNLAVARFNGYLLAEGAAAFEQLQQAAVVIGQLRGRLQDPAVPDGLRRLVAEMGPAAEFIYLAVETALFSPYPPWAYADPADRSDLSMLAYYERACLLLARGQTTAALADLRIATQSTQLRGWARQDRSLQALTTVTRGFSTVEQVAEFKALVGDPVPTEVLALAPFAKYQDQLAARGIRTPEQLAAVSSSWLRSELGITPGLAEHWHELAALSLELTGDPVRTPARMLFLLLAAGVDSRSALRAGCRQHVQFTQQLTVQSRSWNLVPPSVEDVLRWRTRLG